MRKLLYIIPIIGLLANAGCKEALETNPTDKVSGPVIFSTVQSAETAMNGIYRMLYALGWSDGWGNENSGQNSVILATSLMGEDMVAMGKGSGWYYEDYRFNVHGDYSGKAGRSYSFWNFYYTVVSNANYILGSADAIQGEENLKKSLLAEAYAMRSFAYWHLIQLYQKTYLGNADKPGVPLYDKPTVAGADGAPRGTVQQVYDQINTDIDKAITMFKESSVARPNKSRLDYYTANGLKARYMLTQGKFQEAARAAEEALKQDGLSILPVSDFLGLHSLEPKNVMWGAAITKDQSTNYASFFSHMDADAGMYAKAALKGISTGLYRHIPDSDTRKAAWFRGLVAKEDENDNKPSLKSYCQIKFKIKDVLNRTGDNIYMRAEEMILIKAEAECHLEKYADARNTIKMLGKIRDSKFEERLAKREDAKTYNSKSSAALATLMDEILFQRRLELWGESCRIFDIQRLNLAVERDFEGSNHTEKLPSKNLGVGSDLFILPLPQSELDGNPNIGPNDQNKIVQ